MIGRIGALVGVVSIAAACGSSNDSIETSLTSSSTGVTLIVDAQVYTVDAERSIVDSFAYDRSGMVLAVGTESAVRSAVEEPATVLDLDGAMVLPGFQDLHVHVPEAGINLELCFLPNGLGLDAYEVLVTECSREQANSEWVLAAGASLFDLRNTDESPLAVLDRAVPDRPAVVLDDLGHAVWTNSLGLEAAGIGSDDPDPQGGVFHRGADGELTGLLLENGQQLVRNAAAPDADTVDRGLRTALDELARNGVTTISDAGGYWLQGHPEAWQRAEAAGDLTVRAFNTLYVYPDLPIEEQLVEFERRFSDRPDALVKYDTAKLYVDGILDLGTAWMIEPYDVPPDRNYPSGFTYFTDEQLAEYVNRLHTIGYRLNFHAVGDAAVRDALDAVAAIDDTAEAIAERGHRTTHTYLVDPPDVGRFSALGVVADFQQSDDAVALGYHEYLAEFIGERAFGLIPTALLLDAGATVTLSSDWDAGPLSMLGTIERSLTRATNAVPDLETAIELATIDAAFALGHDEFTGSLEVGKVADYVVLDRNLFDVAVGEIDETSVLMTVLAGVEVYGGDDFTL